MSDPQLWGGLSVFDLLICLLLLRGWLDSSPLWRFVVIMLVVVPFLIGLELLSKCRAWITDGSRRCEQPRRGFLVRCADHRSQALTSYDVAGGLALLIGFVNVLAALRSW